VTLDLTYRSAPNWSRHQAWGALCTVQTHAINSTVVSPFAVHTAGLSNRGEDRTRDVKPPTAPSSELGVSSGPEEEDGWRKESEDEANVECLCCAGLCAVRTATVKNGCDTKMCQGSAHSANCRNGLSCVAGARNDSQLFIVAAKCYEKLNFLIIINKTSCFWLP
jgi:hypothetical protein